MSKELKWKWVYIPYLDAPDKQKESAIKAGYAKVYFKSDVDAELESLQASHYAEMVDAGMRERRLKRALCLLRAEYAESRFAYYDNLDMTYRKDYVEERCGFWLKVKEYWQAKAEEYK